MHKPEILYNRTGFAKKYQSKSKMCGLDDTKEKLEGLLDYCVRADVRGIINFGMGVTLRDGDREYFYDALDKHFPGMKGRYHQKYGYAYEVPSDNEAELLKLKNYEQLTLF